MRRKEATALYLESALLHTMRRVKETEGIPITTQVEMAVREWLKKRGIAVKTTRKKGR